VNENKVLKMETGDWRKVELEEKETGENGVGQKLHRREQRKEKSRNAARCRRKNESESYQSLIKLLPLKTEHVANVDQGTGLCLVNKFIQLRSSLPKSIKDGLPCIRNTDDSAEPEVEYEGSMGDDLLESFNSFLLVLDSNYKSLFVSQNTKHHLGVNEADIIGHDIRSLIHEGDHDQILDFFSNGKDHSDEVKRLFCRVRTSFEIARTGKNKFKSSAGNYKTFKCSFFHFEKTENKSDRLYGISLEEITQPHDVCVTPSNCFLTRLSLDFKFLDDDETQLSHVVGFEREHLVGNSFFNYCHPSDVAEFSQTLTNLAKWMQVEFGPYRFLCRRGGWVTVTTQATRVSGKKNEADTIACVHYICNSTENSNELTSVQQLEADEESKPTATTTATTTTGAVAAAAAAAAAADHDDDGKDEAIRSSISNLFILSSYPASPSYTAPQNSPTILAAVDDNDDYTVLEETLTSKLFEVSTELSGIAQPQHEAENLWDDDDNGLLPNDCKMKSEKLEADDADVPCDTFTYCNYNTMIGENDPHLVSIVESPLASSPPESAPFNATLNSDMFESHSEEFSNNLFETDDLAGFQFEQYEEQDSICYNAPSIGDPWTFYPDSSSCESKLTTVTELQSNEPFPKVGANFLNTSPSCYYNSPPQQQQQQQQQIPEAHGDRHVTDPKDKLRRKSGDSAYCSSPEHFSDQPFPQLLSPPYERVHTNEIPIEKSQMNLHMQQAQAFVRNCPANILLCTAAGEHVMYNNHALKRHHVASGDHDRIKVPRIPTTPADARAGEFRAPEELQQKFDYKNSGSGGDGTFYINGQRFTQTVSVPHNNNSKPIRQQKHGGKDIQFSGYKRTRPTIEHRTTTGYIEPDKPRYATAKKTDGDVSRFNYEEASQNSNNTMATTAATAHLLHKTTPAADDLPVISLDDCEVITPCTPSSLDTCSIDLLFNDA